MNIALVSVAVLAALLAVHFIFQKVILHVLKTPPADQEQAAADVDRHRDNEPTS